MAIQIYPNSPADWNRLQSKRSPSRWTTYYQKSKR